MWLRPALLQIQHRNRNPLLTGLNRGLTSPAKGLGQGPAALSPHCGQWQVGAQRKLGRSGMADGKVVAISGATGRNRKGLRDRALPRRVTGSRSSGGGRRSSTKRPQASGAVFAETCDATDPEAVARWFAGTQGQDRPDRRGFQQCRAGSRQATNFGDLEVATWQRDGRRQPQRRLLRRARGVPGDARPDARRAAGSSTTARSRPTCRGPRRRPTRRPSTRSPA